MKLSLSALASLLVCVNAITDQEEVILKDFAVVRGNLQARDELHKHYAHITNKELSEDFYRKMSVQAAKRLVMIALRVSNTFKELIANHYPEKSDRLARLVSSIRDNDFKEMNPEVREVFLHYLPFFSNPESLPDVCKSTFLSMLREKTKVNPMALSKFPVAWVTEDDYYEVINAIVQVPNALQYLNIDVWSAVNDNPDFFTACRLFKAHIHLPMLAARRDKPLSHTSPGCFGNMSDLDKDFSVAMKKLPSNILSQYTGALDPKVRAKLSPEQLNAYTADAEDNANDCSKISVSGMAKKTFASITPLCLASFLKGHQNTPLADLWKAIPVETVSDFKGEMVQSFASVPSTDFKFMKSEVLHYIFTTPEAVQAVHKGSNAANLRLKRRDAQEWKVTTQQFEVLFKKLPHVAGQLLLILKDVPENVLENITKKTVQRLNANIDSAKSNWTKFNVIGAMQTSGSEETRKKFDKIASNFAVKTPKDEHPCSLLSSHEYVKLNWLRSNLTQQCVDALPSSFKPENFLNIAPELAISVTDWSSIIKNINLKKANSGTISVLSKNKEFGDLLVNDKTAFEQIPEAAYAGFSPAVTYQTRSYIDRNKAHLYGPTAFAKFSSSDLSEYTLDNFSISQIPHISEDVDVKSHYFTRITADDITKMGAEVLAAVSPKAWSVIPADQMKGLTQEKIVSIPADNTVLITDAQLNALSAETLVKMSPEQISLVGKEVAGTKLCAFDKVASKLTEEQKNALKERKETRKDVAAPEQTAEASSSWFSGWVWWVIVGFGAIIVIGVVVMLLKK